MTLDQISDPVTSVRRADTQHDVPVNEIRWPSAKTDAEQVGGPAAIQANGIAVQLHIGPTIRGTQKREQRCDRVDNHLETLADVIKLLLRRRLLTE